MISIATKSKSDDAIKHQLVKLTKSKATAKTLAEYLNSNHHTSINGSIIRHYEVMHPLDIHVRASHLHSLKISDYNEGITEFYCFHISKNISFVKF